MILTVAFRFFRNVLHGAHLAINDRDVEEEMGQDIVLHPSHVPETIALGYFSIIIYGSSAKDASHAECRHTITPRFCYHLSMISIKNSPFVHHLVVRLENK